MENRIFKSIEKYEIPTKYLVSDPVDFFLNLKWKEFSLKENFLQYVKKTRHIIISNLSIHYLILEFWKSEHFTMRLDQFFQTLPILEMWHRS